MVPESEVNNYLYFVHGQGQENKKLQVTISHIKIVQGTEARSKF